MSFSNGWVESTNKKSTDVIFDLIDIFYAGKDAAMIDFGCWEN